MNKVCSVSLTLLAILLFSCSDATVIGTEVVDENRLNVDLQDDFVLRGRTLRSDSVATLRPSPSNPSTFVLGRLDDPVFGRSSSELYIAPFFNSSFPSFGEDATIDSVLLELDYEYAGFYGDTLATHNVSVFRLNESFINGDTVYNDRSFDAEPLPLGQADIQLRDSLFVYDLSTGDTIKVGPRLRVRLDNAFGQELLEADEANRDSDLFRETYFGFKIVSEPSNTSMIAFDLDDETNASLVNRIAVYYNNGDTIPRLYNYRVRNETFAHFDHDYAGAEIESFFEDFDLGDSLLFAQAMQGTNMELEIPDLSVFENRFINAAQIIITVADTDSDNLFLPSNRNFLASRYDEDGNATLIQDVVKFGNIGTGTAVLNGRVASTELEDGTTVEQLTLNVTDFIKNIVNEGLMDEKLLITPLSRQESARRTVFYGPGHSKYPVKLRIAYTEL